MTLLSGTKLGRYEIRSKIGEGGMGEVYLARDTQLGRDVALKVLPSSYSDDRERLQRFEQEASAASALNHPNILSIFDVGTHDGSPYVVSELLQGQTLRQRTSGTALSQRKAIDYALQVAHGLAAAHEKGIVHRDLKPDNLFITNDGRVKILDFGLAKLISAGDAQLSQTSIPTRRVDTDPGKVMGTVGYMSPEQVKGRAVDHRSDIFSFGAILYEMLSGRRAFHGESAADTMSAILREDPPELSETNHNVSPAIERLVHHCLEKNREARFHSARDLAFALEALSGSAPVSTQTQTINALPISSKLGKYLPWVVAGILLLMLIVTVPFAISSLRQAPTRANVIRASINQPENASFLPRSQFAISPDGRWIVFVARPAGGKQLLWIRPLGALTAQPLAGTDDAAWPFWSPDSRFIGFFALSKLKKVEASGGPPQTLCDAPSGRGGTWGRDGVIVFAPDNYRPLYRVAAGGGTPAAVTKLDDSKLQATHRWPWFLPDGRHFLYRSGATASASQKENNGIYLGSLDSNEQRLVLRVDTMPAYASGYLLFVRDTTLMAQAFDDKTFQLSGDALPVTERVQVDFVLSRAVFSVSENGVLVSQSGGTVLADRQLLWYERDGKQTGGVGSPSLYAQIQLSPDGKRLATGVFDLQVGSPEVWIYDLSRDVPLRFTFDQDFDASPIWSPDGNLIVWRSNRKNHYDLYQKASSGAGSDEILLESEENKAATSWSSDGRYIAYTNTNVRANTQNDVWILPLFGDRKPFPFLQTQANEESTQFSPDGHWIAYVSDESGTNQVYIAPFPAAGGKWQVSRNGGSEPRWRGDGKEIFFLSPDDKIMAAAVNVKGASLEVANAERLFDVHPANPPGYHYDVTSNGKRFLVDSTKEGSATPLALVVNWTADLKR